jgi:hypothetical protein
MMGSIKHISNELAEKFVCDMKEEV